MAIQVQLGNGSVVGGGGAAFLGANVHCKPIDHGTLGQYQLSALIPLATSQGVLSRLFELRNKGSNLIIPTLASLEVMPTGPVAVPYMCVLQMRRCTNFTALDTTNITTPTAGVLRTGMAAAPGGAQLGLVTPPGASAGMTGGSMSIDLNALSRVMVWMASVSATTRPVRKDLIGDIVNGRHPLVLSANEGFVIENVVLGSDTSNQAWVVLDLSWAEVPVNGY